MFDETCSFETTGGYSGALSGIVKGTIVIENVTNNGSVKASVYAGGIVGYVGARNTSFVKCNNGGFVTAVSSGGEVFCGGIVGYVEYTDTENATFVKCNNGGFV